MNLLAHKGRMMISPGAKAPGKEPSEAPPTKMVDHEYIDNVKTYVMQGTGRFYVNRAIARPGERVKDGKKLYEIRADYSLKRIDKTRKRKGA